MWQACSLCSWVATSKNTHIIDCDKASVRLGLVIGTTISKSLPRSHVISHGKLHRTLHGTVDHWSRFETRPETRHRICPRATWGHWLKQPTEREFKVDLWKNYHNLIQSCHSLPKFWRQRLHSIAHLKRYFLNPSIGTLKPQSSGSLCSNTVIGTLAVDGWAVTFDTASRGLGGLRPHPVPSSLYQM